MDFWQHYFHNCQNHVLKYLPYNFHFHFTMASMLLLHLERLGFCLKKALLGTVIFRCIFGTFVFVVTKGKELGGLWQKDLCKRSWKLSGSWVITSTLSCCSLVPLAPPEVVCFEQFWLSLTRSQRSLHLNCEQRQQALKWGVNLWPWKSGPGQGRGWRLSEKNVSKRESYGELQTDFLQDTEEQKGNGSWW